MTVQQLIDLLGSHPKLILSYFVIIVIISLVGLLFVTPKNYSKSIGYMYSVLVYAVAIPGLLSIILILYNFFFLKANLLGLDISIYFVPLAAMILTLVVINKTVSMSQIPGFDKLSGLFLLIMITFIITYVLQRMFFGVFFIGKIQYLIVFFLALLFGIKVAWSKIMK